MNNSTFQLAGLPKFFFTEGSTKHVYAINGSGGLCLMKGLEQKSEVYSIENIAWMFIGSTSLKFSTVSYILITD